MTCLIFSSIFFPKQCLHVKGSSLFSTYLCLSARISSRRGPSWLVQTQRASCRRSSFAPTSDGTRPPSRARSDRCRRCSPSSPGLCEPPGGPRGRQPAPRRLCKLPPRWPNGPPPPNPQVFPPLRDQCAARREGRAGGRGPRLGRCARARHPPQPLRPGLNSLGTSHFLSAPYRS